MSRKLEIAYTVQCVQIIRKKKFEYYYNSFFKVFGIFVNIYFKKM